MEKSDTSIHSLSCLNEQCSWCLSASCGFRFIWSDSDGCDRRAKGGLFEDSTALRAFLAGAKDAGFQAENRGKVPKLRAPASPPKTGALSPGSPGRPQMSLGKLFVLFWMTWTYCYECFQELRDSVWKFLRDNMPSQTKSFTALPETTVLPI